MTGEYTVVVNGQKLTDKGAIIDGKANVPVRGITEASGADIKVDGKTIIVTTESENNQTSIEPTVSQNNKELTKQQLESNLDNLKNNILAPKVQTVTEIESNIQKLKDDDKEYRLFLGKSDGTRKRYQQSKPLGSSCLGCSEKERAFRWQLPRRSFDPRRGGNRLPPFGKKYSPEIKQITRVPFGPITGWQGLF
ncbi:stalk domain-containing protein [Bacillus sp. FSL K6-6540]|uniref:stalk domain-containing protein n=1 Tax=Bacillus sp. FSL K6-6540 TaxID=2921512 RepID=UPI0030F4DF91